ncbi:hypothetical protein B4N89_41375 [Embleya scabrispora]|uniref:Uncharacterized protein n=1 Tax=Embleya scabrispora TaxID=159449 RepID=A0A1T3NJK7_9ACTN|nr:thiol-activated cytolysin family protein [Embleya scabrispora]OPC77029.1 hypothetical protein B4N89_41375 [Embleya scabrispora]
MAHPPTPEPTPTTSVPSSDGDRQGMPAPAWAVRDGDGTWRVKWCPEVTADSYELMRRTSPSSEPQSIDRAARPEDLVIPPDGDRPDPDTYLVYAFRDGAPVRHSILGTGAAEGKVDLRAKLESWKTWDQLAPHEKSEDEELNSEEIYDEETLVKGIKKTMISTRTPHDIITFDPDVNVMWPGAVVQSKQAIKDGSLVPVGIRTQHRAPVKLAIDALSAHDIEPVKEPDGRSVLAAVRKAVSGQENKSPDIEFRQTIAYSEYDLAIEMGVSAKFGGFSGSISSEFNRKNSKNCVAIYMRERAFTATATGLEDANSLINDDFTEEELKKLENYEAIGKENPPLLVASVIYGRVLTVFINAECSETDLSAAVEASRTGFANIEGQLKTHYKSILQKSEITIKSHGGTPELVRKALVDGNISEYFGEKQKLEEYSIIGYVLKQLEPMKVARMSEKIQYAAEQWIYKDQGHYDATLEIRELQWTNTVIWSTQNPFTISFDGEEYKVDKDDGDTWPTKKHEFTADGRGKPFTIEIKDSGWEGCYVQLVPGNQRWFENGKTLYEGWVTTWCGRGYFDSYQWSIRITARKTD